MLDIERIDKRMREVGLKSWSALARKMKISPSYLADIKSGRTHPSLHTLQKLASALQVSISYLLGEAVDVPIVRTVSKATMALEDIMKDLVYLYPDLALQFRDMRDGWGNLAEDDKAAIAEGLLELFRPDPSRKTRLKNKGSKGDI